MSIATPTTPFRIFTALALAAAIFLGSCAKDDVKTTRIHGVITIENTPTWATWKDSGEVQLTLFPAFSLDPLAGWGAVPDNFFGPGVLGGTYAVGAPYNSQNPLVLTYVPGKTEYAYDLEVEPGTYSALALGFRHNSVADPTRKTATLGVHWGQPDSVSHGIVIRIKAGGAIIPIFNYPAPAAIQIAEGEHKEFDFKADFDFVKKWY